MMEIVVAFLVGSIGCFAFLYSYYTSKKSQLRQQVQFFSEENNNLKSQNVEILQKLEKVNNELMQAKMHIAAIDTENAHLINLNKQRQQEIENLHERLSKEFETIADRVLINRSKQISEQSNQKLSDILSPLQERITRFEKKVEETYDKEVRDKLSLKAEVKRLYDLNHRISEEAQNLSKALKGDVKKLGNWGEVILERVLEQSGLTKGREYRREVVDENSNGATIRPDVIIDLPEGKHLIIDSKMSLSAYEEFVTAEDEETKAVALKNHKERLRQHVKDLFEKNYISAKNINCPDFVLMFIPVEASFAAAVENDNDLFSFAWEKKIVPVSPSTLLATLKTVSSIWRQENQNRNAQEIARQSGALYDKFVGFVADLEKIGSNINTLQGNYDTALSKLQQGKGNLISRAEKIKSLGAKTNKSIEDKFLN
ncbi:DNA recombination protein RmuC [Plebeiibacterium marinum]|uniref:DNA recombination protein RmuC n=1 Tax=Plebeiibacterium marinum TaxID=2992111 RepID=A0AAE3MHT9_9BACT|nr:DNA recombination protein RmuC [Plebeiobacterium marinum]MCW3807891.1 DNA recombination protein RmuC [Plebeiobacterium marinum]